MPSVAQTTKRRLCDNQPWVCISMLLVDKRGFIEFGNSTAGHSKRPSAHVLSPINPVGKCWFRCGVLGDGGLSTQPTFPSALRRIHVDLYTCYLRPTLSHFFPANLPRTGNQQRRGFRLRSSVSVKGAIRAT